MVSFPLRYFYFSPQRISLIHPLLYLWCHVVRILGNIDQVSTPELNTVMLLLSYSILVSENQSKCGLQIYTSWINKLHLYKNRLKYLSNRTEDETNRVFSSYRGNIDVSPHYSTHDDLISGSPDRFGLVMGGVTGTSSWLRTYRRDQMETHDYKGYSNPPDPGRWPPYLESESLTDVLIEMYIDWRDWIISDDWDPLLSKPTYLLPPHSY